MAAQTVVAALRRGHRGRTWTDPRGAVWTFDPHLDRWTTTTDGTTTPADATYDRGPYTPHDVRYAA
ncbi:hypothetical protein ACWEQ4_00895 [Rhodococcus sp. NPDC003994]